VACVGRGRSGRCGRRGAKGRARCAVCQRLRRRVASVAVSAHPRRGSGRGSGGGGPGRREEEVSRMICIYGHVTARLFPMAVETWRDFRATGVCIGQR